MNCVGVGVEAEAPAAAFITPSKVKLSIAKLNGLGKD